MDAVNVKVVYCRVCGIKSNKSVKVFSRRGVGMGLEQKILKCLMLSVKRSDQLPTRVCFPCIDRLDDFSQFLLHVKQAQVKLRALLKSQGVHVKDERNTELISTWKALLAHQERESVNIEKGKKRKRKLEETVYDSSDSLSSDTNSNDSSASSVELPTDVIMEKYPLKKVAIADSEISSLEFTPKNETSGEMCPPSMKPVQETLNSENFSSNLNTEATNICNGMPMISSVPSSDLHSKVSQMQENEITTSQGSVTDIQGSSNSFHQIPTTSDGMNVAISQPIMFPAQVPNSMIVLPGTNFKSPSSGIVPFYIWNVPKGGSSNEVTRESFPQITMKKHYSRGTASGKQNTCIEDVNSYALSKPFMLPKGADCSPPCSETVLMESNNSNTLPSSKPIHVAQISIVTSDDKPERSDVQSDIGCANQGTGLQQSSQCETSVKTNFVDVTASQTLPIQGSVPSSQKSSACSEHSTCNSNLSISSDNVAQIANHKSSQVVNDLAKASEAQPCLKDLREKINQMISYNKPQLIGDGIRLIQLPPSPLKAHGISPKEHQSCSTDSHESMLPSDGGIMSSGDKCEMLRDSQQPLHMKSPKILPVSRKIPFISEASIHSRHIAKSLFPNGSKMQPGVQNSATGEDDNSMICYGGRMEVDHLSAPSVAPLNAATPQRGSKGQEACETTNPIYISEPSAVAESIPKASAGPTSGSLALTNSSHDMLSNDGVLTSNASCLGSTSKSPNNSGNEKDVWIHDLSDIPPLIPITDSFLIQHSEVACQDLSVGRSKFSVRSLHDVSSEPLIIDDLSNEEPRNLNSHTEVASASVKNGSTSSASMSDSSANKTTPPCKSANWISEASSASNFSLDPDFSVVKCCLCSTGSYPFLITLASASDHCKFIHCEGICSFGCIKCDFVTNQQHQISEQLQSLHNHISSGCSASKGPGVINSPQKPDDTVGVVEVKQEPDDVYEKALLNLKNSLRKVNLPRFRKLITSCDTSSDRSDDIQKSSSSKDGEADTPKHMVIKPGRQFREWDFSGYKFYFRHRSSLVCRMCGLKYKSKQDVKIHIKRHKQSERDQFLSAAARGNSMEEPPTNASIVDGDGTGISHSSEFGSLTPEKMIFDIPCIKIEEVSPQGVAATSENDCFRNGLGSMYNPLILSGNDCVSEETDNAADSERRNCGATEGQMVSESDNTMSPPSGSGVKIPFIKGERGKFSSAEKVTHKANTNDSFSFTPLPKGSAAGQVQNYVNHSRNFRSKPIVKPLFKAPIMSNNSFSQSPVSSPSCSNVGLTPKIEKVSPSKLTSNVKHSKKAGKKLSLKLLGQPSASNSSLKASKFKFPPDQSHLQMRSHNSFMKVYRPKSEKEPGSSIKASVLSPTPKNSMLQPESTPSQPQSENMTLNGLVLKVPFIKLQRLNLHNIDPKLGIVTQTSTKTENVDKQRKMKPGCSRNDSESNLTEKSCKSSSKPSLPQNPKEEALEKPEESILGW